MTDKKLILFVCMAKRVDMRRSFTLDKEQSKLGLVWYARFWDDSSKKYALARSTGILVSGKRGRRYEAEEAARVMLPEICF